MPSDLRIALHEAGHAVTAHRTRVPFSSVTIESVHEEFGGCISLERWARLAVIVPDLYRKPPSGTPHGREATIGPKRLRALCFVAVAGFYTEREIIGLSEEFTNKTDFSRVVECTHHFERTRGLPVTNDDQSILLDVLCEFGDDIDCDAWRLAVVNLAATLLRRRTVARYTVRRATQAAYADPQPERWTEQLDRLTSPVPSLLPS